jgi:hypothetical protein
MTLSLDEKVLESLSQIQEEQILDCSVFLEDKTFPLNDLKIMKASTPVNRPTYRGGVYFSKNYLYKVKGTIMDTSIIPLLSKMMLGPNTDFRDILVTINTKFDNKSTVVILHTNLTNSIQSSSKIELNLTIIGLEKR